MDAGKKRRGAIAFSLVIFAILVARPATAEELGQVWMQFQQYMKDLQAYIDEKLPESVKPLDNSAELATEAQGELGIPNPNQVRENVRDRITPDSPADAFEHNSVLRREGVSNELDRQSTRTAIEGELGKEGQARTKVVIEQTEETVDNIQSISAAASQQKLPGNLQQIDGILQRIEGVAGAAESADNTQDVVKLLVRAQFEQSRVLRQAWFGQASLQADAMQTQSEQSKILGQMLSSSIGIHKDLQFSNLNLTNISQQMDAANRVNRVEAAASAARLFKIAAQTDLLLSYPQQPAN